MLEFNEDGLLPPIDFQLTIKELRSSLLVNGPSDHFPWNKAKRLMLVNNLEILVSQLWEVGVSDIFINGSFVTDKPNPSDIDGYFIADPQDISGMIQELNMLDPHKIWDWGRRIYDRNSAKNQLPMWHRYRVELYPHIGQYCGILDEYGQEQKFPSAFRKTRDTFMPKGIIQIIR